MNKYMRTITKILIIAIMSISMLLILPKKVFAISYTFDCYGDSFTVNNVTENDEYALSYRLWKASSIDAFDSSSYGENWNNPGKTVEADFSKAGTDGYYMMRWRKRIRNRIREQCFLWSKRNRW